MRRGWKFRGPDLHWDVLSITVTRPLLSWESAGLSPRRRDVDLLDGFGAVRHLSDEMMEDRIKLPLAFDPVRLKEDLLRLEEEGWIDHFVKQNYSGSWSVIPLRAPATARHPVMMIASDPACDEFVATPFLEGSPYIREVLARIECPLDAVRLMRLTAGSVIKEHRDHELAFEEGHVRLHVPVVTNPDVEFYLNHRRIVMHEGECWYLRLSDPHRVANRGATDRVHLVIDARVNAWVAETFARGTSPGP